jgi:hypothetical protein
VTKREVVPLFGAGESGQQEYDPPLLDIVAQRIVLLISRIVTGVFGVVTQVIERAHVAVGLIGGTTVRGGAVVSTVNMRGVDGDSFHALSVLVTE